MMKVCWRTFRRKTEWYKDQGQDLKLKMVEWTDGRNLSGVIGDIPYNNTKIAVMNFCNEVGEENVISIEAYQSKLEDTCERTVWFLFKE